MSRFSVITLTDNAAARIREIVDGADGEVSGVRLGVKNGGCAGMSYTLDHVSEAEPTDDKVEDKGVTIFVDPKATLFLLGTEMDYEVTKLSSGFVFNNPNQTGACGCGESISIQPADVSALEAIRH